MQTYSWAARKLEALVELANRWGKIKDVSLLSDVSPVESFITNLNVPLEDFLGFTNLETFRLTPVYGNGPLARRSDRENGCKASPHIEQLVREKLRFDRTSIGTVKPAGLLKLPADYV